MRIPMTNHSAQSTISFDAAMVGQETQKQKSLSPEIGSQQVHPFALSQGMK